MPKAGTAGTKPLAYAYGLRQTRWHGRATHDKRARANVRQVAPSECWFWTKDQPAQPVSVEPIDAQSRGRVCIRLGFRWVHPNRRVHKKSRRVAVALETAAA